MDIRRLVRGADPDERSTAAHKLCRSLEHAAMTDEERKCAQDIVRVLAADASELVRRALAVTLRASPLIPRDVALRLARDVESVALPVLNWSPALTDDDLLELLHTGVEARHTAIARRPRLSQSVTSFIASRGCESAVEAACANDNAEFADDALATVLERFSSSEGVTSALAYRKHVPPRILEKLVALVAGHVREHLLSKHHLRPGLASELSTAARERATVDLLEGLSGAEEAYVLVAQLSRDRKLTPSLLLRALGRGEMGFFEHAVAELSGVPHHRTWLMIHDAGPLGLRAIYDRAGLPSRLFSAFRAAVDAYRSLQFEGGCTDRRRFHDHLIQRFLTAQPFASREDLGYLLERLDRAPNDWLPHANAA